MAKKRGGGGSNMGLIITLIFFVLATLILGVTTYFGFADQEAMAWSSDPNIEAALQRAATVHALTAAASFAKP